MARVALTGGAYQSRSLIASAQTQINLYSESNPPESQAPVPVTLYLTPGLKALGISPTINRVRQTYRATNGDLYVCVGPNVYFVTPSLTFQFLGAIADAATPVSFSDNGIVVVLVDGSTNGYCIDITPQSTSGVPVPRTWGQILDPNFLGSNFVDYIDTFFVFNKPGTPGLYISGSEVSFQLLTQSIPAAGSITNGGGSYVNGAYNGVAAAGGSGTGLTLNVTVTGNVVTAVGIQNPGQGYANGQIVTVPTSLLGGLGAGFLWTLTAMAPAFNALDIAQKTGSADNIQRVIVVYRTMWVIGVLTSEGWINSGAADFTFQPLPGVFIEHGCIAPYSVAANDRSAYWLSQDRQGKGIVVGIEGYNVKRVSTHAIESIFQAYGDITDAIGFTFQQEGHVFYVITFPSAGATWGMDIQTKQWFQWTYTDPVNGTLERHRANCCCFAYGQNIVGDWQNGKLYALDPNTYTDDGAPILRERSFPHLLDDGARLTYKSLIADLQVGTLPGSLGDDPPMMSLVWSDDRGATYGNPVLQSMGSGGQYLTSIKWNRLGMARDRVFKISWSTPTNTSVNGAFIEFEKHKT